MSLRTTRGRTLTALAAVLGLALVVGLGILVKLDPRFYTSPESAARGAASSIEDGRVAAGPWIRPAWTADRYSALTSGLAEAGLASPRVVTVGKVARIDDAHARAELVYGWELPGKIATSSPDWTYTTYVTVRKESLKWQAEFTDEVVYPGLSGPLLVSATPAERGEITGAGGTVLMGPDAVVDVGIEPGRVHDLEETLAEVTRLVEVDPSSLRSRVEAAAPTDFVPVLTLRYDDYLTLAEDLRPIPGTVFRKTTRPVSLDTGFATSLLGTVGEASAEDVADGNAVPGDLVGHGGLQETFDDALSGAPGYDIRTEEDEDPVFEIDPVPGEDLATSIDPDVQTAAQEALVRASGPAALVALDPDSGAVLASATGGRDDEGFDRALYGDYDVDGLLSELSTGAGPTAAELGFDRSDIGIDVTGGTGGAHGNAWRGSVLNVAVVSASASRGSTVVPWLVGEEKAPPATEPFAAEQTSGLARAFAEEAGTGERSATSAGSAWSTGYLPHLAWALVVEGADDPSEPTRIAEGFRTAVGLDPDVD